MIRALLYRIAEPTPYFHIPGYMRRWWLLGADSVVRNRENPDWNERPNPERSRLYQWVTERFAIRLHEILRSDTDRHLHDHPCDNISIVLAGGYWEIVPVEPGHRKTIFTVDGLEETHAVWRGPGSIVFRRAADRHRLVLPEDETCWSVFIVFRKTRKWGFYTPDGWVHWKTYLGFKEAA